MAQGTFDLSRSHTLVATSVFLLMACSGGTGGDANLDGALANDSGADTTTPSGDTGATDQNIDP
ncbi:MAG: hypothetical protein QF464_14810, partial [Myxococcota bacterium]|nr:hypothetical protein [Myxococcota bacterium]